MPSIVDTQEIVRAFLLRSPDLQDAVGSRIYAARTFPAEDYNLADGACIVFRNRSELPSYEWGLVQCSLQVKIYASSPYEASQLYRTFFQYCQGEGTGQILYAEHEAGGELLVEPSTGWDFHLSYWSFLIRNLEV